MLPSEVLAKARTIIAGGWHEPLSLDAAGCICPATDEGITRFCLFDALMVAAGGNPVLHTELEELLVNHLVARAQLPKFTPLHRWTEDPKRTQQDVLQLLEQAANHARAQESRAA